MTLTLEKLRRCREILIKNKGDSSTLIPITWVQIHFPRNKKRRTWKKYSKSLRNFVPVPTAWLPPQK